MMMSVVHQYVRLSGFSVFQNISQVHVPIRVILGV